MRVECIKCRKEMTETDAIKVGKFIVEYENGQRKTHYESTDECTDGDKHSWLMYPFAT